MKAAASSWRTWTKRSFSWCWRKDSIMPLMPSPGRPKTTSTPQSMRVWMSRSAAVVAINCSLLCAVYRSSQKRRLLPTRSPRRGAAANGGFYPEDGSEQFRSFVRRDATLQFLAQGEQLVADGLLVGQVTAAEKDHRAEEKPAVQPRF